MPCQRLTCIAILCSPLVLSATLASAEKLYWTDTVTFYRSNLDGSATEQLITDLWDTTGFALDLDGCKIYGVDQDRAQ